MRVVVCVSISMYNFSREARRTVPKDSPPQFRVRVWLGSVRVSLGLGADEKWGGESVTRRSELLALELVVVT